MAQTVVNSMVMRDKAQAINDAAAKITTLYEEMLNEVTTTASKMKGETIEAEKKQFEGMRQGFEKMSQDLKKYGQFLINAAEA